jgi:hypothetical protein
MLPGIKAVGQEPGGLLFVKGDVRCVEQRPLCWDITIRGY